MTTAQQLPDGRDVAKTQSPPKVVRPDTGD